ESYREYGAGFFRGSGDKSIRPSSFSYFFTNSLDRLGLEKVYIQAKRWQNTVGPEAVQAFYGALAGRRATKGVFITTSSYSTRATEFARTIEQIVLIDGAKLSELLMDFGVGVSHREIRIPRIDRDYFEEGE
ncbi:MAG: restriction endonuclease, partial [Myxococcales bacterium]|nr:restriction endonuclease [Myxococcales bacterium]